MCKKGPPAVWTKEKIEEAFAGFVEKNRRLPVAREMKPQYGLPTRRTFERYMDMTAQEYAELRYPTLLSARDERHVQTVLEYRNEVREWSIERLMEAEKNFFTKCGRLPEPYEYTAENGLPTAGLLVLKDHALLGLGLMLSAGEVPRICGAFGLDTSTRANIMSAVYAAQSAVNTTRTVVQAVGAAK